MQGKSLEITTQVGCPLMCTFCPQDKLSQNYLNSEKKMSMATFCTVLDKLPKDVEIVFAGYTEPWANKLCTDFVTYALEKQFKISIYTTLYNLTPDEFDKLTQVLSRYYKQVSQFWVHLPDQNNNMLGFRYTEDFEYVLGQSTKIKLFPIRYMTMDAKEIIDPQIKIKVRTHNWYFHTRANNLEVENIKKQSINMPPKYEWVVECTRQKEYHANVLLPNGDVILCCMDYSLQHKLGNLLKQSYDEILHSKELESLHKLNNDFGFSTKTLCKSCNDAHCHTPWNNIDVYNKAKTLDPGFSL